MRPSCVPDVYRAGFWEEETLASPWKVHRSEHHGTCSWGGKPEEETGLGHELLPGSLSLWSVGRSTWGKGLGLS